jgi:predicted DNA-binding transcriptional regulator YafY
MARPPMKPERIARIWRARGHDRLTVKQTAKALGVSSRTIRKYCDDGFTETLRLAFHPVVDEAQQKTPA